MKKLFLFLVVCVFLAGCGYQPIAHQANKALGGKVFVEVKISLRDPQNSVELKDSVSRSIFERLHSRVVDKQEADSVVEVELQNVLFHTLAENKTGFATFYRCEVNVRFKYTNRYTQSTRIFSKKGYYNFSLGNSSNITDSIRMEAINEAVIQALDGFISQVGIETF
ncbi:LPS assembly lipoprotein LptE [Helicobacter sp. 14348-15]|uniref:LPS assembly lipoprotein LptE n=1 Tax=Helicobacter colisuis TaxID=2949739 RepID=A0ABT0TRW7_9HELI|nr:MULTISPECIES: LptE family protein [Helicobacter]MCI7765729.1 LPS assembly lipoprotein LptE [Helicobacter sp.]MCL9818644.1 LPS assembly lipoprotein LptE [Helicobacter colisuis]MCL9820328.1 LPS assembly lipoprotein LptE [Helicobacter colisuis]MCL9822354.1 LPS assembly lipoprotein LptE [Helicobacter colisuis]